MLTTRNNASRLIRNIDNAFNHWPTTHRSALKSSGPRGKSHGTYAGQLMSRINSWARPPKRAGAPPPLYLLPGGKSTPYCRSCGRVIGKTSKNKKDTVKYCSERCRRRKPVEADRQIEQTFVALLNGVNLANKSPGDLWNTLSSVDPDELQGDQEHQRQGGLQSIVLCSTVQGLFFGQQTDSGTIVKKVKKKRGIQDSGEWRSVDMEDTEPLSINQTSNTTLSQNFYDLAVSNGDEDQVTTDFQEDDPGRDSYLEGQRRAEQREAVRRAARRLCAFGTLLPRRQEKSRQEPPHQASKRRVAMDDGQGQDSPIIEEVYRKCEPVLRSGTVVEASFAKGDWGIRWREE